MFCFYDGNALMNFTLICIYCIFRDLLTEFSERHSCKLKPTLFEMGNQIYYNKCYLFFSFKNYLD